MKLFLKACALAVLFGATVMSCDSYKDSTPDTFEEADKDLTGVWQLATVSRNGIDITEALGEATVSQFKLHMNSGGTYTLENRSPFPVRVDGTWEVDDPVHPMMITFKESGSIGSEEKVEIKYPNIKGARQLLVTHSPGCPINKYEYKFIRLNK